MYIQVYMNYITTTDLRTKSKDILKALEEGRSINLIHRSKIVGEIKPASNINLKTINANLLEDKIQQLDLPRLTLKEIDRGYRAAMRKKHGKGLR